MTLLYPANGSYFRVVVTYSHYNRTYTDTNLRDNKDIDCAMIEANPCYNLDHRQKHWISCDGGKNWKPYVRSVANDHHAEARAITFSQNKAEAIMVIYPTKRYCQTGKGGGCLADIKNRLGKDLFLQNENDIQTVIHDYSRHDF